MKPTKIKTMMTAHDGPRCVKCGDTGFSMSYTKAPHPDGSVTDFLMCQCRECGFTWRQACLDSWVECTACFGSGVIVDEKCENCDGRGGVFPNIDDRTPSAVDYDDPPRSNHMPEGFLR